MIAVIAVVPEIVVVAVVAVRIKVVDAKEAFRPENGIVVPAMLADGAAFFVLALLVPFSAFPVSLQLPAAVDATAAPAPFLAVTIAAVVVQFVVSAVHFVVEHDIPEVFALAVVEHLVAELFAVAVVEYTVAEVFALAV